MEDYKKSLLVHEIMYGKTIIDIMDRTFFICTPSNDVVLKSELVYYKSYEKYIQDIGLSELELSAFLEDNKIWLNEDENSLSGLYEDMENLKVGLFEASDNYGLFRSIKGNIRSLKIKLSELLSKKHQYDYLLASHLSQKTKLRYILKNSIYDNRGCRIQSKKTPFDLILNKYIDTKISEEDIREMARTDPWRSYWISSKHNSQTLFGKPSISLSENQRMLISISQFYDNIHDSPDCPSDDIINDDDALDGWLILQKRKRDKDKNKAEIEGRIKSDKVKNSDEVYIVTGYDKRDIKKVASLNTAQAQYVKKERSNKLAKFGEVFEGEMPDVVRNVNMGLNRLASQHAR